METIHRPDARSRALDLCRAAADTLVATLLAPECASCGTILDRPTGGAVCAACWNTIDTQSARSMGRRDREPLDSWVSAARYEGHLRSIVQAFKYDGRRSLSTALGHLMVGAGGDILADAACVVPVPLHPWRRLRRGFNQAADLAGTLGPPVAGLLRRTHATPPQAGLSAVARRRNVRDAFALARRAVPVRIADRVVVLVDDVRTTGATLDACALVLRRAGAAEVRALTVAWAPHPESD